MNSEKHTGNINYYSYKLRKKKRNRRIIIIRSILLVVLLLAVVLLFIFGYIQFKKTRINDYYDTENGYTNLIKTEDLVSDRLVPFASDLAVLNKDTDYSDEMLTSDAGLITGRSGGNIISAKAPTERMNPASTTKIMTALCALKYGNIDDLVVITNDALITEEGASLAYIKPGQTYTLRQLLYGLLLPSGNDAANAIAIHVGGSIDAFVDIMNKEATEIGAADTHFKNPHGMTDEDHYTTAYDLYLMLNEAMQYPDFIEICSTKEYNVEYLNEDGTYGSRLWKNTNKYITGERDLPETISVIAGKTGTTLAAGHCLVMAVSNENDDEFVTIVLKSDTTDSLYNNMDYYLSGVR
ncbi:MAG: serine hydrolase [Lachnospiraceae bacterium]|nr:serine hydrolase [Lachnospiraceae bacterium]